MKRAPLRAMALASVVSAVLGGCNADLSLIVGSGGASNTTGTTTAQSSSSSTGAGGAMVSCATDPSEIATLPDLTTVPPVLSGLDLYYITDTAATWSLHRISVLGGPPATVGILSPSGTTSVPARLAVSDDIYVALGNPFEIKTFAKNGGASASLPIPGLPATMIARPGGGLSWVRLDTSLTFLDSPFTYGETGKGTPGPTADVHRFDDDAIFPPIASRAVDATGFPTLFAADSGRVSYAASLQNVFVLGQYDVANDAQVVITPEFRTAAACLPGETPTSVGGPVGAELWEPTSSDSGDFIAYWISRSNNCQVGVNPPVHRTTTELVAFDTKAAMRYLLVPPTPFPDTRISPGPLAMDDDGIFYSPPAGPPHLVRKRLIGGPEVTVLDPAAPTFLAAVGQCVIFVDRSTTPAKLVSVVGKPPIP